MKIYSRVRMGWDVKTQAYKTIESTFEEYHGEVAQCGLSIGGIIGAVGGFCVGGPAGAAAGYYVGSELGEANNSDGGDIVAPETSTAEQQLQEEQLAILQAQQERTEQMDPFLLQSMGLILEPDTVTPAVYEQQEIPGTAGGSTTYYNEYGQEILSHAAESYSGQLYDENNQPVNYGDVSEPTPSSWEQVEVSPETITPGEIRAMTEEEWLDSMTVPQREAYDQQLAEREQQQTQYEFQQEQWQAQQDRWEQADADNEAMKPFLLASMGIVEEEDGTYRHQTEEERYEHMTEVERGQYDLTLQAQERQRMAYAGELPISPALEKSLEKQQSQITEALSQRLGTDWQLTTPGQQAMGEFSQRADLVREEARRGEISNMGGLLLGNLGYLGGTQTQQVAQRGLFSQTGQIPSVQSVQHMGGIQNPFNSYATYPQLGSTAFSGYGMLQQPYQQQRQNQFQASIYNQQAQAQQSAGMWAGLGSLAGAGIGAYGTYMGLAAASSRMLKKNIKTIKNPVDQIMAIRGVDFTWKSNGLPNKGVIAEELEKIIPEAIFEVDGVKGVEYHQIIPILVEAIKVQQQEIAKLKECI